MARDLPLKNDVHLLGTLLGETLKEVEGEKFFQLVEKIRKTAIHQRKGEGIADFKKISKILNILIIKHSRNWSPPLVPFSIMLPLPNNITEFEGDDFIFYLEMLGINLFHLVTHLNF